MRPSRIPKARIFVVDEESVKTTLEKMEIAVLTPSPMKSRKDGSDSEEHKEKWLKTIADIAADMLQMQVGDYIFLWVQKNTNKKNKKKSKAECKNNVDEGFKKSTIYGVFRVLSEPYYEVSSNEDKAPFKIKIGNAYRFENGVTEYEVLNSPFLKGRMWNLIGKKVAGKSRASSPLTFDEVQGLIDLLIGCNKTFEYIPFCEDQKIEVKKPLCINLSNNSENVVYNSIGDLDPNSVSYVKDGYVIWEKVIEAVFNQEISRHNKAFLSSLDINDDVLWFSNYLPYSIERSEMDYMIITSEDGIFYDKIFLLEFQKGKIDEDHIKRTFMYTRWINETLAYGKLVAQPIIICEKYPKTECDIINFLDVEEKKFLGENDSESNFKRQLRVYTYIIKNGQMHFERKR